MRSEASRPWRLWAPGFLFFAASVRRMLEEYMSVWPVVPSLSSREGDLVSVSIPVTARDLEALLEALARVDFPINPQIYHDAGAKGAALTTLVEFPAYAGRLQEVRQALAEAGFDPQSVSVTGMWEEIHGECSSAAAGQGNYQP